MLCQCTRELWLYAAKHSTEAVIVHKPGKELVFADALSRRFLDQVVTAHRLTAKLGLHQMTADHNTPFTNVL